MPTSLARIDSRKTIAGREVTIWRMGQPDPDSQFGIVAPFRYCFEFDTYSSYIHDLTFDTPELAVAAARVELRRSPQLDLFT